MFGNEKSRHQVLIAAVALAAAYTCVRGVSKRREVRRISDASAKQSQAIAEILARIDENRLSVSTVSHTVEPLSSVDPKRAAPPTKKSFRSLVHSCAAVLSVFESNGVRCVGTEKGKDQDANASTNIDRYQVNLQGGFRAILNAMEEIEADLPHSCVVSCSMDIEHPAQVCNWTIVFEFTEN